MRAITPKVCSPITSTVKSSSTQQFDIKGFFDSVKQQKGITSHTDWYSIKQKDLEDYPESRLLSKYRSLSDALTQAYPNEQWLPWMFADGPPRAFFHSKKNQKRFIEWFAQKHYITKLDDWYSFQYTDFARDGGKQIIRCYGSFINTLKAFYPEHNWMEWRFPFTTRFYWKEQANRRAYFDWLAQQLGYTKPEDWYQISYHEIAKYHGRSLIETHAGSVLAALKDAYPDYDFKPWLFNSVARGYWDSPANRREFLDWAAVKLGITKPEDWYSIHCKDLYSIGGKSLINACRGSLLGLLKSAYPEINWIPWKFNSLPDGFWNNDQNVQSFLHYLNEHYDIKPEDLFSLTQQNVREAGGSALLKKYNGFDNVIKKFLPHLQPPETDREGMSKGQQRLQRVIESIFPGKQVLPNHRITPDAEVDIYVPEHKLAIEYQGEYHYQWDYIIGSTEEVQQRDQRKRDLCKQLKIELIEIPFWWDRHKMSVAATIRQRLPDLPMAVEIPPNVKPISPVIPKSVAKNTARLQSKAMDAGVLQGFGVWGSQKSAVGRLLSICPVGQRCLWDGTAFVDHQGNPLSIPETFFKGLPPQVKIEFVLHTTSDGPQLTAIDTNSANGSYLVRIHEMQSFLPSHIKILSPVLCTEEAQYHHMKEQCIKDGNLLLISHPNTEFSVRSLSSFIEPETLSALDESLQSVWVDKTSSAFAYTLYCGPYSKCRSCQKSFKREDLRLQAHGVFVAMDGRPYKVKYSLCLSPECIAKAVNKSNSRIVFPPFDNRIAVPSSLKQKGLEQKLDQFKDVELVFLE